MDLCHYLAGEQNLDPQVAFQIWWGDVAVCCNSRSDSICPSPGANPRLCNWQASPYSITETPQCFTIEVIRAVVALSPTYRRSKNLLFDPKISNFDLCVERTLFHSSIVQFLFAMAYWSLLTLFCFLKSGFSTVILPYRTASQSLLLIVDIDTFFTTLVQLCSEVWGSQPSVTQVDDSDEIVLCSCCCFWSTSPTIGLLLFHFLMSPSIIIQCSPWNIL